MKKGDKIVAVFSVGVTHPLYQKEVEAIVDFVGGYDGRQIHAHTVEEVHYPADPEGILVYGKNGKFLGYQEREAYDEIWEGYVERVIKQDMDNKITAVQVRQIAEANGVNKFTVKSNIDYILEKIIKEANKGELHAYISTNELKGNDSTIQKTFAELSKLGYIAVSADFDNNSKLYKVTW